MQESAVELVAKPATSAHDAPGTEVAERPAETSCKDSTTAIIISSITGITLISSLVGGLITVELPTIVRQLPLSRTLMVWPLSIYALTCGCTLILSGAIADVVGARNMYLLGSLFQSAFTLACGLAQNGFQLILFRALAGIAISFCLPSAVSLVTRYFPHGKRRNFAFGAMGGGQPLGFTIGLTIGGILTDRVGWRFGFYVSAGINAMLFLLALFGLPKVDSQSPPPWQHLWTEIDWTGAFILSLVLGMLSYAFVSLTGTVSSIRSPATISCFCLSFILIPTFVWWVGRQERRGRTAIIRNSLWRNKTFTSMCLSVFLTWGAFNAVETLLTFFFQDVQELSATQTSVRFLPHTIAGTIANIVTGLIIHRVRANRALLLSFAVSAVAPLLLAVMRPRASYWEFVFPATAVNPIGADTLYTISNLIITAEFPDNTQALAGGVFNSVAQIGKSVGLALSAIIASSVTLRLEGGRKSEEEKLFEGYKAAWWFCFACTMATLGTSAWGLKGIGRVGLKRE